MDEKISRLLSKCLEQKIMIATAESCTGGLLAAAITEIPGSSAIFDRGFVTYSNAAKHEMLGIPENLIAKYGAVSKEIAEKMAAGALVKSKAQITISITGIAGPGGGTASRPVGLVYIGAMLRGKIATSREYKFTGNRQQIRTQAIEKALDLLLLQLENRL